MCRKLPFEKLVLHESTRSNDSSNLHTMYRETAKNEKNWSWQLATSAWYTYTAFYAWVYSIIVPILSVYWLPPRPSYLPIIHFQLHLYIYILKRHCFPNVSAPNFRSQDYIGTRTSWHLRCVPPLQHTSPCHGRTVQPSRHCSVDMFWR